MNNVKKIAIASVILMTTGTIYASTSTGSIASSATGSTSSKVVSTSTGTTSTKQEVPTLNLVEKTGNSVKLEWTKISSASSYVVRYGTKSVAQSTDPNASYEKITDPVIVSSSNAGTGTTISDLTPNTTYYFTVVTIDSLGSESDAYSDELEVKTDASTGMSSTGSSYVEMTGATIVDSKTIKITASKDISSNSPVFKITSNADNSTLNVESVTKEEFTGSTSTGATNSGTVLVIKLIDSLKISSSYSINLASMKDAEGKDIDTQSVKKVDFTTLADMVIAPETMNAAGTESGATASGALVNSATSLPATGTKEVFLLLGALLVAGAIMVVKKKNA